MSRTTRTALSLLMTLLGPIGCGTGLQSTRFVNPKFDFSFVERVAVLPFENFSNDRQAGERASRITITELLASGAVDVVEPGEVAAVLRRLPGGQFGRVAVPSTEQMVSLGKQLGVQALILGTVTQSENLRAGTTSIPVVTLDLRMVETETGATVWAATHTEKGSTLGARVLGTVGEPLSETTRRCVQQVIRTLVE